MRHENFFIITREIEKIKALSASYGLTTAHEHYRHNKCVETREVKIRLYVIISVIQVREKNTSSTENRVSSSTITECL